jgi:hypothetical protein
MVVLQLLLYLAVLGALGTTPLIMWIAGVVVLQRGRSVAPAAGG